MVAKIIASPQFCIDISTANLFTVYFCTSEVHLNTISLNDKFFFVVYDVSAAAADNDIDWRATQVTWRRHSDNESENSVNDEAD